MKYIKYLLQFVCRFTLILFFFIYGKTVWEQEYGRRCYNAILPGLNLCLPKSYFTFKNFTKEAKVGYNWETFFLPVSNEVEGANQLRLNIPRESLPILPPNYDDGNHGMIAISLRPLYLTAEERRAQLTVFPGTVFNVENKEAFIHCDYHDHERGNPTAKKYCLLRMDWDADIRNPRIELSFSIAPADFDHWQINAQKVRKFLLSYAVNHPSSITQSRKIHHD